MNEIQTDPKMVDPITESQAGGKDEVTSEAVPSKSRPQLALRQLRAEAEIDAISRALDQTRWNRRRAAELLSISYRGLLYKIRQHNITSATVVQATAMSGEGEAE